MTDLFAARSQMAISLGFHIVFASIGIAMPFLMAISHWRWLKTKEPAYLDLTKAWSKGVAIFFATGAVSGTVLSFELGLLWPKFMEYAGPISGLPFAWEGTAFFLEAIALGIFLYGWDRIHPWAHWASGVIVGFSGVASGMFVICANGWMNAPAGFDWVDGRAINIDPVAAMFNRAALQQGLHMTIAAFLATGFAVAGIHAVGLLKKPDSIFHAKAFQIALVIGAIPSEETQTVRYGIHIPKLLSFLAHGDFEAEVIGLDQFPRENWPPVAVTHFAFQIMVGIGVLLAIVGAWSMFALRRRPERLRSRRMLRLFAICAPLGFIAIEAGWTVTEVGRQPWIIYGFMRTEDAVTPMPGLIYPMMLFTGVYLLLAFIVTWLMVRQFRHVD